MHGGEAFFFAAASLVVGFGLASCRSAARAYGLGGGARGAPPKDEIWLSDDDVGRLQVTTEEVKLQSVDETVVSVGPVVANADCPVKPAPEERKSCIVVAVDQAALGRLRIGGAATARSSALVHDVFPGDVAWIAGTLDAAGRTAKVACLFPDAMGELRPGRQTRVELTVGARPAYAVSRAAVIESQGSAFVFTAAGTTDDGRHKFVRIPVRPDRDTGGPWLPVADLQPGSFVVRSGAQALASMLAVTAL